MNISPPPPLLLFPPPKKIKHTHLMLLFFLIFSYRTSTFRTAAYSLPYLLYVIRVIIIIIITFLKLSLLKGENEYDIDEHGRTPAHIVSFCLSLEFNYPFLCVGRKRRGEIGGEGVFIPPFPPPLSSKYSYVRVYKAADHYYYYYHYHFS